MHAARPTMGTRGLQKQIPSVDGGGMTMGASCDHDHDPDEGCHSWPGPCSLVSAQVGHLHRKHESSHFFAWPQSNLSSINQKGLSKTVCHPEPTKPEPLWLTRNAPAHICARTHPHPLAAYDPRPGHSLSGGLPGTSVGQTAVWTAPFGSIGTGDICRETQTQTLPTQPHLPTHLPLPTYLPLPTPWAPISPGTMGTHAPRHPAPELLSTLGTSYPQVPSLLVSYLRRH